VQLCNQQNILKCTQSVTVHGSTCDAAVCFQDMLHDLVGKTSFMYHVAKKWNSEGLVLDNWTLLHASYMRILMDPICFLGGILNSI
jgi:hypothetical protein